MRKARIGESGIEVAALGMGCWAYGGGSYWGAQSQADVNAVVHAALDSGINYFDTAEVYNAGESERSLGLALKGRRGDAVIGTKFSPTNARQADLIKSCEQSLSRLQTDYIDIYMLHWPVNPKACQHFGMDGGAESLPCIEEIFGTLRTLQDQGKIREIGVSNHGVLQMKALAAAGVSIAVNELPYNLISRAIEAEILPWCQENKIAVLGYMAYQQGVLTGDYADFGALSPGQAHSRHFHFSRGGAESRHGEVGAELEIQALLKILRGIADELGVPVATVSLAWAMANPAVAVNLVGSRNLEQLRGNIQAAEFTLPEDALRALDAHSKPVWDALGDSPDYYEHRSESRIY